MMYSFVLSDALFVEYYKFKQNRDYDKRIIKNLLSYYSGEFISNTAQYKRNNIPISKTLNSNLRHSGLTNQTLEELAKKTIYKHILTLDNNTFPYINIFDDQITAAITGCFYRDTPKGKALSHIKSLCEKASFVYIYDKYLDSDNAYQVLPLIFPDKELKVYLKKGALSEDTLTSLKRVNRKWDFIYQEDLLTHHDRYIIIDDEVEVVLTSGFLYLNLLSKELSYIIRPINRNRLLSK